MKSFKTPLAPRKMSKGMPTKPPMTKNSMKSLPLAERLPFVRPTTMRNLGPVKGKI